ncbi:MAG: Tranposon-transfer assisting protein [uncultured Clostridium sp.]
MKKSFNKEELTIMNFYNCDNRNRLINELESVVENIDEIEVETEVREIIIKLKSISDSEFKEIDFKNIIEVEEEI